MKKVFAGLLAALLCLGLAACAAGEAEEMVYGEFTLYTPENNAGLPLAPQE